MLRAVSLGPPGRGAGSVSAAHRLLVDEIGVAPGAELRGLNDAILRQDAAALDLAAAVPR